MAAFWSAYDKKDEIKFPKHVDFPFEAVNFNRQKKLCYNKKELLEHLLCKDELKPLVLILAARVHPEFFISEDSFVLIGQYVNFKRYGMQFLYPKGMKEIPNIVFQAFQIISSTLEQVEADAIKSAKSKDSK
ncbi:MAG: hypothetical protein KatS3mg036_0502 [Ignavibacterium sp.]|uniref:hypothetical protein n=1 Tax=Ignavibacterium sp. TaxID=2651167 RepID=UPI0021DE46CE|nr:hypothetical protein [Ignavibacterium sp.]BDQ01948.1 MAG: hypothetical protein KatS3mg037_0523 [Ignavibacterium sp.]GIV45684.1 MAG: hypothetical protein KatS3mg036_0502 [Ignavibacterium sp.]